MKYPLDFITCINSIGNGLVVDMENETTLIKPKGGFGGIGGSYVKPTGWLMCVNFTKFLKNMTRKLKLLDVGGLRMVEMCLSIYCVVRRWFR